MDENFCKKDGIFVEFARRRRVVFRYDSLHVRLIVELWNFYEICAKCLAMGQDIFFPPFRLDIDQNRLLRGFEEIPLRAKTFAVLRCLVEHSGELVKRDALLTTVWKDTRVEPEAPTICVRDLRRILGDDARRPQFIETVHGLGYRFIGRIEKNGNYSQQASMHSGAPPSVVGRELELDRLRKWLEKGLRGKRQIIFVTGEAGIGKSTLVETFLKTVQPSKEIWIERGQCVEHYGPSEAYLPVLDALGRSCRRPGGERFIAVLRQYAPTWLVQMPAVIADDELEIIQRKVHGVARERMLREMAEALEVITTHTLLVIVLEDLHWSDPYTLDLLSYVAQRQETARLLIIATYRPEDAILNGHPLKALKQDLMGRRLCEELSLETLPEVAVADYLSARFPNSNLPSQLAQIIHEGTEGNPLFMVNLVDNLVEQRVVKQIGRHWTLRTKPEEVTLKVPESLRLMIERQIERLPLEEQQMLEAASVAGVEFSSAAVATVVGEAKDRVERWCEGLVRRRQFLRMCGTETEVDGMVRGRYEFSHILYQNILYTRLTATQRIRLHRYIGEYEEKRYGNRAGEIAAELAVHFERGQDYHRVVQYLLQAAKNAIQRNAPQQAVNYLNKGLELLKTFPETVERNQQELALQTLLGSSLIATKGYAAPEVEEAYGRAQDLCQYIGEIPHRFTVLRGLCTFYMLRAELQKAQELAEQLFPLAQRTQERNLLLEAHQVLGATLYFMGQLTLAREHLEHGMVLYNPQQHHSHTLLYGGADPGVTCRSISAWALSLLGYPDQARKRSSEGVTLGQELSHPFSRIFALNFAAGVHLFRREGQQAQEQAGAAVIFSTKEGFPLGVAMGMIQLGWALVEQGQGQEGIAQIRRGITIWQNTGAEPWPYYLALLAEACGKVGKVEEGISILTESVALVNKNGERFYEAELYRLKGELLFCCNRRRTSSIQETEQCFLTAIEIARKQQAKSWELRAVMSLSRLWRQQGKKEGAWQLLAEIYGRFTEGFDTKDLQEARALLEELT